MSKSPRALEELMTAVDAGRHAVDGGNVDSASSDGSKLQAGPRRRRSTNNGRGSAGGGVRKSAPEVAAVVLEATSDVASFEFGAVANNSSSASPASMVFSDGQLRAHQFPAVRSSSASAGGAGSNQPALSSPVRTSSVGSYTSKQQGGVRVTAGSTKRVSFATDGPDKAAATGKAGGGQGKKSGGLLGCCGSPNEAVEPVARNDNRKVEAF